MSTEPIMMFYTEVSDTAINKVVEVLRSGMLNEGLVVKDFESKLEEYLKSKHAITTNSATSALHLCLKHLGVGPGDEVILPPQTFIATGLVVLHCGATPVFTDIDPETGNLDPEKLESRITSATKAIMPVHWGGEPCDMNFIQKIADAYKIPVVEDAAHAFGAEYQSKAIGINSRFACFSFQAIKGMTTGDGGMIATNNEDDARGLLRKRWFGMIKGESPVSEIGERTVPISTLGFKYHNIYPDRLKKRRSIAKEYLRRIKSNDEIRHIKRRVDSDGAFWLFPILVRRRLDFARAMKGRGVPVSVIDRRIDKHPVFGQSYNDLTGASAFDESQIHIPIHDGLNEDQVELIISSIEKGW
jgi:perosamine synthetase